MSRRVDGAVWLFDVSIDVASIGAASSLEVTATCPSDLLVGDTCIGIQPPSNLNANLVVGAGYVSAAAQIKFRIGNPTAGAIDPAVGV